MTVRPAVVRARLAHLGFVLGQLDDLRAAHQALGRLPELIAPGS